MITGISLQQFRSYEQASFEFDDSVNIIVGPNASGKTNLLEAILVIARGSSYRTKDVGLIKNGVTWARIDSSLDNGSTRVVKITLRNNLTQKSFEINDKTMSRLSSAAALPVVLFEPDHLQLLHGSPDLRRAFLDSLIEQIHPSYNTVLKNYKRTIQQRNNLLKKPTKDLEAQLFVWNIRAAELGGKIVKYRTDLTRLIQKELPSLYKQISTRNQGVAIKYISKFDDATYESSLLHALSNNIEKEVTRGYTLYGPHREDIAITIDNEPAEETASRGEVRTLLLSLKIIELRLIEGISGKKPILLLDDVFSELDGARRQALTSFVSSYQTFITTTDADLVLQHFTDSTKIIPLMNDQ